MRQLALNWTTVILTSLILVTVSVFSTPKAETESPSGPTAFSMPEHFIPNEGQWPEPVKFRAVVNGVTLWFTTEGVYHQFSRSLMEPVLSDEPSYPASAAERILVASKFVDATATPEIVGVNRSGMRVNFLFGRDPSEWRTDIPVYDQLEYRELYPGIDMVYRFHNGQLEYDIRLAPGATADRVQLEYLNVESLRLDSDGTLIVNTPLGVIQERLPAAYQETADGRVALGGQFRILGQKRFGFELLGQPDEDYPTIIDPLVTYVHTLGSSGNDEGFGVAVDDNGSAYLTGYVSSFDFPVLNPFQPDSGGGFYDAVVVKLNAGGTAPVWASYLGGSSDDRGHDIAVDESGAAYVTGYTFSGDFPTAGAFQSTHGGGVQDAFLTKISPSGNSLVFSTYLGGLGDDIGEALMIDNEGRANLTGHTRSTNFPTADPTQSELNGNNFDAFVTRFSTDGTQIDYSTYLGGTASDYGRAIVLMPSRNIAIAGYTRSSDFPVYHAYQDQIGGDFDMFVANITVDLAGIGFLTFLGGSGGDYAEGITVDDVGAISVAGYTLSNDFPTNNSFQANHGGGLRDIAVARLSNSGDSLEFSSYLGGSDEEYGYGAALTSDGRLCVTGTTYSTDYPLVGPHQTTMAGNTDAVVSIVTATGSGLSYSTYLGGDNDDTGFDLAIDDEENIYLVGTTGEPFQTSSIENVGRSPAMLGLSDIFAVKFSPGGGCCGLYTSGHTGNTDCDGDGKRNLADITRLIDRVYVSKNPLCCEQNGNTDGDAQDKLNLADVTKLIDHVYISKAETAVCN